MEKTIKIDGTPVTLSASCGALVIYRQQFGREYFDDLASLDGVKSKLKLLTMRENIGFHIIWAMARAADDSIPAPDRWLDSFERFPVGEILTQVNEMLHDSMVTHSEGSGEKVPFTSENLLANCIACGIDINSAMKMPLGFLIDTLNAYVDGRNGKHGDRIIQATQADYDNF